MPDRNSVGMTSPSQESQSAGSLITLLTILSMDVRPSRHQFRILQSTASMGPNVLLIFNFRIFLLGFIEADTVRGIVRWTTHARQHSCVPFAKA